MTSPRLKPTKRCFVTVGATASFISLIQNVLQPTFLEALKLHNYTELRIQYGKNGKKTFDDYCWLLSDELKKSLEIEITGFDFNKTGLKEEMLAAKRIYTTSTMKGSEGCVISHAGEYTVQYMGGQMAGNVADEQALGSGSILEAMRIEVPVIVVPNTDLLDNHQVELAEVLAEQNYVVHGSLRYVVAVYGRQ